ncbi:MAG: preprotein translocase subunit SecA [Bacteroidota bacterium]|jgi:preprotein translocase subunit SecA
MFESLVKGLGKLFGNKSDRDVKEVQPLVEAINEWFQAYQALSNDELRNKTNEFVDRINLQLAGVDEEIAAARAELEATPEAEVEERDALFSKLDELEKDRDKELEKALEEILPEAFAVVKEAARRYTEIGTLEVQATEHDRTIAAQKAHVRIDGDKAFYSNEWVAAGGNIRWNMVHYDVQLIGGIALHKGKIAEMATGEGKTLVSTLPAYLNALGKRGVHIVTVNDYLARRDSEWNGPLFEFLGLTVDCIDQHQPNSPQRRKAYEADITYGTNNEFGFDYLRDNMSRSPEDLVQRKHHYAMVDEVDSVLIDDARTPLIISGPTPKGDDQEFVALKPRIQRVVEAQKKYVNFALNEAKKLIAEGKTGEKDGGMFLLRAHRGMPKTKALIKYLGESGIHSVLHKTESYYLQDQQKEMPKVDAELYFVIDEKNNTVELTEKGIELITESGEDRQFFLMPDIGSEIAEIERTALSDDDKRRRKDELMRDFAVKSDRIHSISQLLKAYTIFERDVDYIIQDGKVKIVDEQTGRILEGRRYSDGLHQAIEAKENVKVEAATQTYATITLQNYFRMYHKLAGMTGTAETEAQELWDIYKLDVMVIPTNRPAVRKDMDDFVYKTRRVKFNAVIDNVVKLVEEGRPVLVGTTSVEISELLSRMLKLRNIRHNVLNAKQHQSEAQIVAEAGNPGTVTIATNMAGRGTDIKISDEVKAAGGLAIIGTERHESRRVDRQLRGRAGRQGDPGTSQFYVSLEDDLMRIFGSERVMKLMDRMGYKEDDVIQASTMTSIIERNQKRMEQNNYGIRKRLLEYDDVMNKQRTVIYSRRKNALFGERLSLDLRNMLYDWCDDTVSVTKEQDAFGDLELEVYKQLACDLPFDEETFKRTGHEDLAEQLFHHLLNHYNAKNADMAAAALPVFRNIQEAQGGKVDQVVVPITDGTHVMNVVVGMSRMLESNGASLIREFEKDITLEIIDDEWKEHLRELDDLKQASPNAQYEQKDPLLIYKIESFNLFRDMMRRVNNRVLGMLFRGNIDGQEQVDAAQTSKVKRNDDLSRARAGRDEVGIVSGGMPMPPPDMPMPPDQPVMPGIPLRQEPKIGRNDPCFCGSGKKFKNCHGQV